MTRYLLLIFVLAALSAGVAVAGAPAGEADPVGKPSPAFETADIAGNAVSSAKLMENGKVVVLNFWGLRCGACLAEMPSLNGLHERYKEKVTVLGVNNDGIDGAFLARQIGKMKLKIDYTVVPDPEMKIVDLFRMTMAPLTFVIDAKGVVRYRHENYTPGDEKELEEVVRSLVGGK
jgi:peroxiredoxin